MKSFRLRMFVLFALSHFLAGASEVRERPALVVVISIDQFRYDYLERFHAHFGPNGFNLFLDHGANFVDCHHPQSYTKTGPGHAGMLTGVCANRHGIIANDWIDRTTFEWISCVADPAVKIIGLPSATGPRFPGTDNPYLGPSPRNLLVTTVGDELKLDRGGKPKVIGISNKDRAAILMSGKLANAAYFMERGLIVSSTYYMQALPDWVRTWNAARKVDAYFGAVWNRLLPAADYAVQDADDAPGEDRTTDQLGNTLPKTITGGEAAPGPHFYDAFENSPFSNEVLADFVEATVEHERLGDRAGVTDLLCVSFSANDHIGHLYGPDSHEIMDNVVRMDRTLAKLFAFLDQRIGLRRCTIVLTADHGVSPTPEHVHAIQPDLPAGRIDTARLLRICEEALNRSFGPLEDHGRWLVAADASLLIHPGALAEKKLTAAAVQPVMCTALLSLDFMQAAYTRDQLERGDVHDELGRRALLSFNRERSGDVYFQAKPFYVNRSLTGTNHGAPYSYDTHVPLLWYGIGVKPGLYSDRVTIGDLAPTLSRILGIPAPSMADGRVLF